MGVILTGLPPCFCGSDCVKSCAVNGSRNFAKEDNFELSSHVWSLELPVGLVLLDGVREVMSVQEVLAFDDYVIDACFEHLFSGHHSEGIGIGGHVCGYGGGV